MRFDTSTLPDVSGLVVGILGGTGDQGRGLAIRLAQAGQRVLIGSRTPERAAAAAAEIAELAGASVEGGSNAEVSERSDLVIVAVPFAGHADTLRELVEPLRGKIIIDCVNPLGFGKQGPYPLEVPEGSAAEQAAAILPESRVTAAFHHVSAELLGNLQIAEMDLDVLVLGEDREAVAQVQALAGRIKGIRGVYAGRLRNAGQVEALTANLIAINKRYGVHAGLRITDL
jgi:NADPH-dependent F420 reductase